MSDSMNDLGSPAGAAPIAPDRPSVPATESGHELLLRLGMDAEAWCAEMKARGVVECDAAPGSDFHGWMCNAIMTAYDIGHSAGARRITNDKMLPLLRMALKLPHPWLIGIGGKKGIPMEEWTSAVDSICGILDRAKASVTDPDSKEARDERGAK